MICLWMTHDNACFSLMSLWLTMKMTTMMMRRMKMMTRMKRMPKGKEMEVVDQSRTGVKRSLARQC
ncbi:hypothetical protein Pint_27540 [Pistacia integerrima]|uniref:Uncharacterized protein n=1 Tax=Pistacia integerrima TaxID=434235 RepID=A0ACC0YRP5_9ROSI|nr:hypothetical protein Pint_27540 [Pistacia integerrima]